MRAAVFFAVLLAVGHLAAAQDECPFKEADLSEVKWSTAKTACAAPEPGFCSSCICGLRKTIVDGLTKKGISVPVADQAQLINNCLGALLTPLTDPKVGNMEEEVGKLGSCEDPTAIAAKCPGSVPTSPAPKPKVAASPAIAVPTETPSPAPVAAVPAASPADAPAAASSPPPTKSAAGAVVVSVGAVAAVALLQAMLL